jgi:glycosyltransferase involved in cell wall biosynthesis
MADRAPLLVFADDWGRHPSSCQHLISRLLSHRQVTWVNTIGTRPPGLNLSTITRGFGKLKQWALPKREAKAASDAQTTIASSIANPLVLNPKMWPSFRSRVARSLNRRLLTRALTRAVSAMPAPPVVVTTLPLVADLVGAFPASRWVYYCVDDFSVWPGLDGRTMRDMEAELVPKVNVAIAVSETLQAHLAKLGKPSHLLTHGVDLEQWHAPANSDIPVSLASVRDMPKPLAVYWGVIDRRTDLEFVQALNDAFAGTILFAGPQDNPAPELLRLSRVRVLPPLPFADLPALANLASVLIAPYADLPVTRAMQPLKLKEYMATGKPVVVRQLPATAEWNDCVDVVDTPSAFAHAVVERVQTGVLQSQLHGRERLNREGWNAKAAFFAQWCDGDLP